MDNVKTGALIREARTARGMTQKQLAEALHITDRAVSKWERGLSAPDIALLEPLAEALGVTVLELIRGERDESAAPEAESAVRETLDYSRSELKRRIKSLRLKHLLKGAAGLMIAALICFIVLSYTGIIYIIDDSYSSDGSMRATVYSKAPSNFGKGFSTQYAVTVVVNGRTTINYGDCKFLGLQWAPGSNRYVLELEDWDNFEGVSLEIGDWDDGSIGWLNPSLTNCVAQLLPASMLPEGNLLDMVEYKFIGWSEDSQNLLIRYSFVDTDGLYLGHYGYFWYNCVTEEVSGVPTPDELTQ